MAYITAKCKKKCISIPRLRTHAGAVASSRLVRRDLYSVCFSSVPPTAAVTISRGGDETVRGFEESRILELDLTAPGALLHSRTD